MSAPRVRIAPSPTGDPHVGTAYVGLFNRAFAHASGGTFVLRIDDTDRTRYRPESEAAIFRALRWLGLEWDEGPDKGGPHAPYRQSERTALYRAAAARLLETGRAYRCFCTPERLAELRATQREQGGALGYDRRCRGLTAAEVEERLRSGTPHVVRLAVPLEGTTRFEDLLRGSIAVENETIDDQVLLKSDGFPTYHLANVVDDSEMEITHVIRAEEWIVSTPKHILIYQALGEAPPRFCHVPLLRNPDHTKISKRKNPVSLDWYRGQGYLPEALLNFLALLGWSPPDGEEVFDYEKFQRNFRLEAIHTTGPVFDLVKLNWLNGVYVRSLSAADLTRRLVAEGFLPESADAARVARILPLVAERLHRLADFADMTRFYFEDIAPPESESLVPKKKTREQALEMFTGLRERLEARDSWTADALVEALESFRTEHGLKKPQLFMPLRQALTGRTDSPPIEGVLEVLGKDVVLERLSRAIETLRSGS